MDQSRNSQLSNEGAYKGSVWDEQDLPFTQNKEVKQTPQLTLEGEKAAKKSNVIKLSKKKFKEENSNAKLPWLQPDVSGGYLSVSIDQQLRQAPVKPPKMPKTHGGKKQANKSKLARSRVEIEQPKPEEPPVEQPAILDKSVEQVI